MLPPTVTVYANGARSNPISSPDAVPKAQRIVDAMSDRCGPDDRIELRFSDGEVVEISPGPTLCEECARHVKGHIP